MKRQENIQRSTRLRKAAARQAPNVNAEMQGRCMRRSRSLLSFLRAV